MAHTIVDYTTLDDFREMMQDVMTESHNDNGYYEIEMMCRNIKMGGM